MWALELAHCQFRQVLGLRRHERGTVIVAGHIHGQTVKLFGDIPPQNTQLRCRVQKLTVSSADALFSRLCTRV